MWILMLLSVLLSPSLAMATTYYVGTSGGGGCSTNRNSPSGSISNSINCLGPGDTLYFRGGNYSMGEIGNVPSGNSWNSTDVVTIGGDPQDGQLAVHLNPASSGQTAYFEFSDTHYVILDNFDMNLNTMGARGVHIGGTSHHVQVSNSELRDGQHQAILTGGPGNRFINLHIHNLDAGGLGSHGIYNGGNSALIQNCHIHHMDGYGIHGHNDNDPNVNDNVYSGNTVHDTGEAGILFEQGGRNIAYNNVIYNSNTEGIKNSGGFDNQAYNNTMYNNNLNCLLMFGGTNLTFRNNICYGNNGHDTPEGDTGEVHQDHNLLGTDPKFINAGAANFRLQNGSPAINAGVDLTSFFTVDRDGNTRVLPFDIGAYEFGGGPSITITSPTCSPCTRDVANFTELAGSASAIAPATISNVTWACPTCTPTSGTASGTTNWSVASIGLAVGLNNITVTAKDSNNATAQQLLKVTRSQLTPIAWWKFEEGTGGNGTTTVDSADSHPGTLQGGPVWVTGRVGTFALQFDGVAARVDLPDQILPDFTSDHTVCMWASITNPTVDASGGIAQTLLMLRQSDAANGLRLVSIAQTTPSGTFGMTVTSGSTSKYAYTTAQAFVADTWTHVCEVLRSGNPELYVGGVSQTLGDPGPFAMGSSTQIGSRDPTSGNVTGKIDDVKIWNRALSATEVSNEVGGAPAAPTIGRRRSAVGH